MGFSMRTYKEAVDLMVDWWVEKSFKTPLNQNNGDNSDNGWFGHLLMNNLSRKAQEQIDEFKIQKFKGKLTEILLDVEGKGRYYNEMDVDYHPNEKLQIACRYAEIDPSCLPCKTFTFINNENEIEGRYQYGGDWFKI